MGPNPYLCSCRARAMFHSDWGTLKMLIRRPARGMHLRAPVEDGADGVCGAHGSAPAGLLDAATARGCSDGMHADIAALPQETMAVPNVLNGSLTKAS